jgi:PilZ domain
MELRLSSTPHILQISSHSHVLVSHFFIFHALLTDMSREEMTLMVREQRKNFRVEWNSAASIYDFDGDWTYDCVVKDFSNGGAKITGVPVNDLPDRFMLRFLRGPNGKRGCHVLWRSLDTLGVEFTDVVMAVEGKMRRVSHAT